MNRTPQAAISRNTFSVFFKFHAIHQALLIFSGPEIILVAVVSNYIVRHSRYNFVIVI